MNLRTLKQDCECWPKAPGPDPQRLRDRLAWMYLTICQRNVLESSVAMQSTSRTEECPYDSDKYRPGVAKDLNCMSFPHGQ